MARLCDNERSEAIGMLRAGMTHMTVARHFGCSRQTVHNFERRYTVSGTIDDLPKTDRPRILTPRQDAYIQVTPMRNRFLTASGTAKNTIGVTG